MNLLIVLQQVLLLMSDSSSTSSPANTNERKKVIVIGAGFSGLAVAYDLQNQHQFDVQILEARDRIGGRVHPYDIDGTVVDLGGQWVHESSRLNPMRQLMEELQIPFQSSVYETIDATEKKRRKKSGTILFDKDGKLIDYVAIKSASKMFYKALNQYNEKDIDVNTSFQDLLDRAIPSAKAESDEQFLQTMNYLRHRTECYEGGRLYELSAYLDEIYQNLGGPDEIPKGGYNEVLKAVASKIGADKIRLNCIVDSIDYCESTQINEDGKVTITLEDGEWIKGDYCVCTAPLGVLQHRKIRFTPPLPEVRWKAIDAIGMGLLDKVVLKFNKCFWGDNGYFGASNPDPTLVKNFYDCTKDVGAPVLLAFLGGDAARRVDSPSGLSDEEAVTEAMEQLRTIFGSDAPDPIATKVTRWNLDPFALGAYSYAKVGSTEDVYDEVAAPVGNLLFAGEHTSKHAHSCVHGAWATGQREAKRLSSWLSTSSK
jgi:polyamine oxidase